MTGKEKEVGEAWDALDVPGKKAIIDGGAEAIKFSAADNAKVRQIGDQVSEAKIKELEGKGLPARAVYTQMRQPLRQAREDLEELLELGVVLRTEFPATGRPDRPPRRVSLMKNWRRVRRRGSAAGCRPPSSRR